MGVAHLGTKSAFGQERLLCIAFMYRSSVLRPARTLLSSQALPDWHGRWTSQLLGFCGDPRLERETGGLFVNLCF